MKQTKIFLCALALLSLAACEKKETQGRKVTVTIKASIGEEESAQPKAYVTAGGKFSWRTGDEIGVYTSDNQFTRFVLSSEESSSGAFSAELDEGVTIVTPGVAVYPYHAEDAFNMATHEVTFNLPTSYAWQKTWGNAAKPAMYANVSGGNLTFHHLGGMVRIPITDMASDGTLVRFVSTGKRINGAFTFNLDDAKPQITADSNGDSESITEFTFSAPGTGSSFVFNVPIPAGDYSKWSIRTFKKDGGFEGSRFSLTSEKARTVAPGDLVVMGSLSTAILLADFNSGKPDNVNDDYATTSGEDGALRVEHANGSGLFSLKTSSTYYDRSSWSNAKYFRMSVKYNTAEDAAIYYPCVHFGGSGTTKYYPVKLNGVSLPSPLTAEAWASAVNTSGWNTIEYNGTGLNINTKDQICVRAMSDVSGNSTGTSGSRVLFVDNFVYLK